MHTAVSCRYLLWLAIFSLLLSCRSTPVSTKNAGVSTDAIRDSLVAHSNGNWPLLLHQYDSVLNTTQLSVDNKYWMHKHKLDLYVAHHLNEKALACADTMAVLADAAGITYKGDKKVMALNYKAGVLFRSGRYNEALDVFALEQPIADTISNYGIRARYNYSLAMAYYKGENYRSAARFFKRALFYSDSGLAATINSKQQLQQLRDLPQCWFVQELLDNIGLAYLQAGSDDSAMIYLRAAQRYIGTCAGKLPSNAFSWDRAMSVVDGNIAVVFDHKGMVDSAVVYCEDAVRMARDHPNGRHEIAAYSEIQLAKLYVKQRQYNKAADIFREMEEDHDADPGPTQTEDSVELCLRLSEAKALYYNGVQHFDSAFKYLQLHHACQEKSWDLKHGLLVSALDNGLGAALKQSELDNLRKDDQIALLKKTIVILATVSFCLILAGFIFRLHRRNQKMSVSLKENKDAFEKIAWAHSHVLRGPLVTARGLVTLLADEGLDETTRKELFNGLGDKLDELDKVIIEVVKGAK